MKEARIFSLKMRKIQRKHTIFILLKDCHGSGKFDFYKSPRRKIKVNL